MIFPATYRDLFPKECGSKILDSTALKVVLIVIGILFVSAAIAMEAHQINTLTSGSIALGGCIFFLPAIFLSFKQNNGLSDQEPESQRIALIDPQVEEENQEELSSSDSDTEYLSVCDDEILEDPLESNFRIQMPERDVLEQRFHKLPDSTTLTSPDGSKINSKGSQVWGRLVLFPTLLDDDESYFSMWNSILQNKMGTIVRIDPQNDGLDLLDSKGESTQLPILNATLKPLEMSPMGFEPIRRSDYNLTVSGEAFPLSLFSIEDGEQEVSKSEKIYHLLEALNAREGVFLIPFLEGNDFPGAFATCWHLYQLHKEYLDQGIESLQVDPLDIFQEVVQTGDLPVGSIENFSFILDFVDFLNSQS